MKRYYQTKKKKKKENKILKFYLPVWDDFSSSGDEPNWVYRRPKQPNGQQSSTKNTS